MPERTTPQATLPPPLPGRSRLPQIALEIGTALSLAFLVWLYMRTRDQESINNVSIPVQITLAPEFADHYDLEVNGPAHVEASFVGPPSGIRELHSMLQGGEVRVKVPISVPNDRRHEDRYRDTVRVQAADIPAPAGVTAVLAEGRNRIPLTLRRLEERPLRVRLNQARDERVRQVVLEPETVVVRGPEDILERARRVLTRPYHLPASAGHGRQQMLSVELPLLREMEGRPIHCEPAFVKARIYLQRRPRIYQLKEIPVKFLCPTSFPYRPQFPDRQAARIMLRVKAPAEAPPAVAAFVDLTKGKCRAGLNVKPLRLQLPRNCKLAQKPPGPVEFELAPTEIAPGWRTVEVEP
jgi:hypothetical protein